MASNKSIFGLDDRVVMSPGESSDFPLVTVAKVVSYWADGYQASGTGVMVGRADVLTASHVLYSASHGGAAERVEVMPGYDRGYAPFGSVLAKSLVPYQGSWFHSEVEHDLVVIELMQDIGLRTGWIPPVQGGALEHGTQLVSFGYPGDIESGTVMVSTEGSIDQTQKGLLIFSDDMDIAAGQSGSPLFRFSSDGLPSLEGIVIGFRSSSGGAGENYGINLADLDLNWVRNTTGEKSAWVVDPSSDAYLIGRYYLGVFDRLPDQEGLNYWMSQIDAGTDPEFLADVFLASPEFAGRYGSPDSMEIKSYVRAIYLELLGREPDSAGLDFWSQQVLNGLSPAEILVHLARSDEAKALTTSLLAGIHQDPQGYWLV